jgi:hypothetical protein
MLYKGKNGTPYVKYINLIFFSFHFNSLIPNTNKMYKTFTIILLNEIYINQTSLKLDQKVNSNFPSPQFPEFPRDQAFLHFNCGVLKGKKI